MGFTHISAAHRSPPCIQILVDSLLQDGGADEGSDADLG